MNDIENHFEKLEDNLMKETLTQSMIIDQIIPK